MTKKSMLKVAGITATLLLIPLISMQFTNEVNWQIGDFLVGGALIFGAGLLIQLASEKLKSHPTLTQAIIGIAFVFVLVWAELAVGIFGSPFAGS